MRFEPYFSCIVYTGASESFQPSSRIQPPVGHMGRMRVVRGWTSVLALRWSTCDACALSSTFVVVCAPLCRGVCTHVGSMNITGLPISLAQVAHGCDCCVVRFVGACPTPDRLAGFIRMAIVSEGCPPHRALAASLSQIFSVRILRRPGRYDKTTMSIAGSCGVEASVRFDCVFVRMFPFGFAPRLSWFGKLVSVRIRFLIYLTGIATKVQRIPMLLVWLGFSFASVGGLCVPVDTQTQHIVMMCFLHVLVALSCRTNSQGLVSSNSDGASNKAPC